LNVAGILPMHELRFAEVAIAALRWQSRGVNLEPPGNFRPVPRVLHEVVPVQSTSGPGGPGDATL
jgi:hypothetical protein